MINLTLKSDIDYTTQNLKLRELIGDMEKKIRNFKPTPTRKSYTEGVQAITQSQNIFQNQNQKWRA